MEVAQVWDGHVAASASALHIISSCLSKQRNLRPLRQREHIVLIFQQDHPFTGRSTRQLKVLFRRSDQPASRSKRKHRRITKPSPVILHTYNSFLVQFLTGIRSIGPHRVRLMLLSAKYVSLYHIPAK